MEESNSRFRGRNVSDLGSRTMMLMIHGIVTNDLYIGDYFVHGNTKKDKFHPNGKVWLAC